MNEPESLADWLRLTLIPGIGGETQRRLLTAFGLPEAVFAAGIEALSHVIGNKAARLLQAADNRPAVERALAWAEKPGHRIVCLADADYPQSLLQIPDPPTLLYVVGRVELLDQAAVAVVGSRNPTAQGVQNAERFAASLTQAGLSITSGLALGIDAAAHRGALVATDDTVAFIGTGIDRMYPVANHALAREIASRGAIVSEFPLGTPPVAANFPRRNRLISGLSRGVLVIEATIESGSLISARLAAEQGREVFAIPGSIHSPQSRGCHKLIKQGAKLVETVEDVLDELNWTMASPGPERTAEQPEKAGVLLQALGFDPCSLDELVGRSGLTTDVVSVMLLHLELDGLVATLPGGRYQRIVLA